MFSHHDLLQRHRPAHDAMACDDEPSPRPHAMRLSPVASPRLSSPPLTDCESVHDGYHVDDADVTSPGGPTSRSPGSRHGSPERHDRSRRDDLLQQLHARRPLTAEQQLDVLRALPALPGWPAELALEIRSHDGDAAPLRLIRADSAGQAVAPVVLFRHADGQIDAGAGSSPGHAIDRPLSAVAALDPGADAAELEPARSFFGELLLALIQSEGGWRMLARLIQDSRLSSCPTPQDFPRLESRLRQRVIDTLAAPRQNADREPASDGWRSPPAHLTRWELDRPSRAWDLPPRPEAPLSPRPDRSPMRTWTSPMGASTGAHLTRQGVGTPPQPDQWLDDAQRPGARFPAFLNPAPPRMPAPSFGLTGLSSELTLPPPVPGQFHLQLQQQLLKQQQQLNELLQSQSDMQAQVDAQAQALSAMRTQLSELASTNAPPAFTLPTVVREPVQPREREPRAPLLGAAATALVFDPPTPAAQRLAVQIQHGAWPLEKADVVHRLLMMAPSWPPVRLRIRFRDDRPLEMRSARSGWSPGEDGSRPKVTLTCDMQADRYLRQGRLIRDDLDEADFHTGANRFFDALMYAAPSEVLNWIVVPIGQHPSQRSSSYRRHLAACQLRDEVYALARTPALTQAMRESPGERRVGSRMGTRSVDYLPAPGMNFLPSSEPPTEAIDSGPTRPSLA